MGGFKFDAPKTLDTLVPDILEFLAGAGDYGEITPEGQKQLAKDLSKVLTQRLTSVLLQRFDERGKRNADFLLRMSNYGRPDRQLWFDANSDPETRNIDPNRYLNFLLGDILEVIVLFLAETTGHKVERCQETVVLEGMEGHIDAVIDGVMCDVKSASKWAFENKFTNGGMFQPDGDGFAYIPQIKGYGEAMGIKDQAFVVVNKENGMIGVVRVPDNIEVDTRARVKHAQEVIKKKSPPSKKCYAPVEYGKSGNKTLHKNCAFCDHKLKCWTDANGGKGLRAFNYSNGTIYMTDVENTPKVEEINPQTGEIIE